jgi:hypothetical protein
MAGSLLLCGLAMGDRPAPTLQASMKNVIIPQAQIVWDVTNAALDDKGDIDAARLDAAEWSRIALAARALDETSRRLAGTNALKVLGPGEPEAEAGGSATLTLEQVQSLIDAKPTEFAAQFREFAGISAQLAAAAEARDGAALNLQLGRFNEACEGCHQRFWYPQ